MKENKNIPLMFIDSIKDDIKDNTKNTFDSRKMDCYGINKNNNSRITRYKEYVDDFKKGRISICKYNDQLIIPYKLDSNNLYGIKVLVNINNQYERLKEEIIIPLTEDIILIH